MGSEERRAAAALLGLALAEALVVAALSVGAWSVAAGLHLLACIPPLALRRLASGPGRAAAALRLCRALLSPLGPVVVLGALLALPWPAAVARARPVPLPPDPIEARLAAVLDAESLSAGLKAEALSDVLHLGEPAQREHALALLAEDARPASLALLQAARLSPIATLRAEAEVARPRAEQRLREQEAALRAALAADPAAARPLARHLGAAAATGLLPPALAQAWGEEAVTLWRRIAATAPGDAEAQAALGQALLAQGDVAAARVALEGAVARGGASPELLGALAECLFRQRDLAALDTLVEAWAPALEAAVQAGGLTAPAWRLWLQRDRA